MKRIWLFLVLGLWPSLAHAVITIDATATGQVDAYSNPGTTTTFNITIPAVANSFRLLVCFPGVYQPNTNNVSSATHNGQALTFLARSADSVNSDSVEIWYRKLPATGTSSIVVTTNNATYTWVGCVSMVDVDQTTTLRTASGSVCDGNQTSISASPTSVSGDLVLDGIYVGAQNPSPNGTQTQQFATGDANNFIEGSSKAATSTSTTMQWTWGANTYCAFIAVAVVPNVVAPTGPKPGSLTLVGVGK